MHTRLNSRIHFLLHFFRETIPARFKLPAFLWLLALSVLSPNIAMGTPPRPLGSFNFDFDRLGATPAEQLRELRNIGYAGLTMNMAGKKNLALFDEYLPELQKTGLTFYAGYIAAKFTDDNSALLRNIEKSLQRLKSVDASFWLIVRATEQDETTLLKIVEKIAQMADEAGVELILYPHDNCEIESAEDALAFTQKLGRNLKISLHLCHEIRAGNGDRLSEIAVKLGERLALPSINGADCEYHSTANWSQTIQPLDCGDFDPSLLLQALDAASYRGPVVLHTFALHKVSADHHHRSFKQYLKLNP